jgi:hypothetical protein
MADALPQYALLKNIPAPKVRVESSTGKNSGMLVNGTFRVEISSWPDSSVARATTIPSPKPANSRVLSE